MGLWLMSTMSWRSSSRELNSYVPGARMTTDALLATAATSSSTVATLTGGSVGGGGEIGGAGG